MDKKTIMEKYYTPKILIGKNIINDVMDEMIGKNKNVLIFGLGYDSNLYYYANDKKNILYVETNDEYIKLCKEIDTKYVVKHDFKGITVKTSFDMTDDQLDRFAIPKILIDHAPYDIILIDAPVGCNPNAPGRLLPIYWTSKLLSHIGTIVYIDDTERPLESLGVKKYFSSYELLMKDHANAETSKFLVK